MSVQVEYKKQFLFGVIFIIIILSVFEISARLYEYSPVSQQCVFVDKPAVGDMDYFLVKQICIDHNSLQYSTFPNSSVTSLTPKTTETININSFGLRGPEFTQEKSMNDYRIFLVGGSSTFGSGSVDENTITGFMQKLFDDSDFDVEVINAGIPGAESFRETWLIRNILFDLDPDLIIHLGGYNEARMINEPYERDAYRNYTDYNQTSVSEKNENDKMKSDSFRFNNFPFYRTPFVIYDILFHNSNKQSLITYDDLSFSKITTEYYENWKNICDISAQKNIKTVIILQPASGMTTRNIFPGEIDTGEELHEMYQRLAVSLDNLGKHCSLTADFKMIFDDINQPIFFDQIHTGDFGNKIIAEKIYEKILPIVSKDLSN